MSIEFLMGVCAGFCIASLIFLAAVLHDRRKAYLRAHYAGRDPKGRLVSYDIAKLLGYPLERRRPPSKRPKPAKKAHHSHCESHEHSQWPYVSSTRAKRTKKGSHD